MALGLDALSALKAGVERETAHHVATFLHADVLGRDRADADPLLQALDGFVVATLDFLVNRFAIRSCGRAHGSGEGSACESAGSNEVSASESSHGAPPGASTYS
jgi:hypothetical protein